MKRYHSLIELARSPTDHDALFYRRPLCPSMCSRELGGEDVEKLLRDLNRRLDFARAAGSRRDTSLRTNTVFRKLATSGLDYVGLIRSMGMVACF